MTKPGRRRNYTPTTVPFRATPAGETLSIAQWAHPMVWTERMLATLQTGVKGGRGRWPNDFFAAHGLYSLSEAHTRFVQSPRGNY
jgi:hypothetical protein